MRAARFCAVPILRSTEDDFTKLRHAWQIIQSRIQKNGVDSVFNFTGLERGLRIARNDMPFLDDELAPGYSGNGSPRWRWSTSAAGRTATTSWCSTA
jgi:hypothetical protein